VFTSTSGTCVTLDHNDHYAYVASLRESTIVQFSMGLYGVLTPMSTPTVTAGNSPAAILVDPTDQYAYAANFGANAQDPPAGAGTLSLYTINTDGSLSPMSTPTVAAGSGPYALVTDPAGKFLYAVNVGMPPSANTASTPTTAL
jgi:6-phosphogluconolactonase (cycloisomerase 2 family)